MITYSKKVCLLGEFAVGKTSLVRRFVYNMFDDAYISSIGVKVSRKTVTLPDQNDSLAVTMMLWDISSSEEFVQIRDNYLRGAAGAVLVCDLTRPDTIANLHVYTQGMHKINPQAHMMIAANKRDLPHDHFIHTQVERVAAELRLPYLFTSAKTGDAVEAIFEQLAHRMVQ